MDQLKTLLLSIAVLFGVALKAGIAIGATGTVLEAFGLFLRRFANPKVKAVGSFFEQLGKKLEAVGTDIPKFVGSAKVWYGQIARLLGIALVFFLVMTALSALQACGATKPCPVVLESQYGASLLAACKGSPSLAACPQYQTLKAQHEAAQEAAGCRVKP